ncbi:MAG TPA: SPOR domain-containing protein [Pseudolabrys sp.]|jgi:hypothetical protein|nr:SPOR domain-containing protein [Pseudolabrys sp.]
MADDNNQRPYRSNDPNNRGAASAGSSIPNDPLAELARLIGQNDPFAEFGRDGARRAPAAPPPAQNWNPQQQAPAGYQQAPANYQPQPAADPRTAPPAPAYGAPAYHVSAPTQPRQPPFEQQAFSGPGFDRPVAGAQGHMTGNNPYHGAYDHQAEAPQHPGDYETDAYYQQQPQGQGEDYYEDPPAPKRRVSILAIAGIFMLAVVGAAGAYGYRQLFGYPGLRIPPPVIKADTAPSKIVPAPSNEQKSNAKVIYDRVGDRPQTEKVVSREETPVDIKSKPAFPPPPSSQGATTGALQVSAPAVDPMSTEPKKIHTIVIRPDQPAMPAPAATTASAPPPQPAPPPARAAANPPPPARVASAQPEPVAEPTRAPANHRAATTHRAEPAAGNAPLSLSPDGNGGSLPPPPPRNTARVASAAAHAEPASRPTKLTPPPAGAAAANAVHGYAVQVSSQRSEADAEASFRALQAKYPQQLGGRQPVIRRADLGAKGVYYRAMVGPFANGNEATSLCSALKAAGGSCIIQKN